MINEISKCSINNNNLKGASTAIVGQQPTLISFPQTEIDLISKSLEIARLHITQESPTISAISRRLLSKVEKAINIILSSYLLLNNNNLLKVLF